MGTPHSICYHGGASDITWARLMEGSWTPFQAMSSITGKSIPLTMAVPRAPECPWP
jgi:hypothetical protein